jgi:hypothetical protein
MTHPALNTGEPLSPELVLVAPELADQARALLPDRPWEAFVAPQPYSTPVWKTPVGAAPVAATAAPVVVDVTPVRVAPILRPPVPVPTPTPGTAPVPAVPGQVPIAVTVERRRRVTRGRVYRTLAAAGVLGLLVAGSLPIVPNGPTLEAAEPPVSRSVPPPTHTRPSVALGNGGYTAGRILTFRTTADGASLLDLTSVTDCGDAYAPGPIAVTDDGSFAARFGSRPSVEVRGRFVSSTKAVGTLVAEAPGCSSTRVPFAARIS